MKQISLGRKILAGFIGCSLALIIIAVISFKNSERRIESNQLVTHTQDVLNTLQQILINADDAETSKRGFVITGEENFLEPFHRAVAQIPRTIGEARIQTKDNPEQQQNVARIEQLTDTLIRFLNRCITTRRTEGFEKTRAIVASGEGTRILDALRIALGNARDIEERLLAERQEKSNADVESFNRVFLLLVAIIVIVLVSVYLVITANLRTVKRLQDEADAKNWSLTGSGGLGKVMQGNKPLADLAQDIISYLAAYLDAQVGALYITDETGTSIDLAGAYALDKGKKGWRKFHFGEGLAGQSAAEKKTLLLTDIPADRFTIDTGFGKMPPACIIALPVVFETKVVGVVELGSLHLFTEPQQQFLQLVMNTIGIAITSSQATEKTKELLEETQRQSEELDAQQEELKQANDTLLEKNMLLEKSEAELKAQQEELQQTNEELEEQANLLEEQKERLETARAVLETKSKELEQTSRYKSEFLANMSHELRTPLNSILILAQLLKENKHQAMGPKEVEYAGNIFSSGNDLLNLINEILDLAKVEAGKIELDIAETDLGEITGNLQSTFGELARSKSVRFDMQYHAEKFTHPVKTDRQKLEQILRNLLSNAFKFTDKGGRVSVDIDIAAPDGHIARGNRLQQQEQAIAFSVTDSGIGIPADKQEIIFQAFQQADGSTKRKYGGTGLGLSISRELAHALGGEISLDSEEGKGSRFTLWLPLQFEGALTASTGKAVEVKRAAVERPARQEARMPAREIPANATDDRYTITENDRCILVIEDDPGFAKLLLQFLRERGYKGIIAEQGNTGLSLARYYRPDAIILDMQLPVMDGGEVLKHLKNDPELRHIPVQIFSGYDRRKESMDLGAFDFIRKPVMKEDLQSVFDRIGDFLRKKLKRLLVVEDNRQHNSAIRELIGNGDVESFSAHTGSEAYGIMQKEKFDCVIIDLGLPDMSGFELLEKIKASTELNKIPIIVYTGKDLSREETNRLNKLANTVVLKTANSTERLLDEATLFLHRMESKLPREKQQILRKLHRSDEVLKNKTALIVDDDMRNIYSLTNALEEEGVHCLTAGNGREAIHIIKEHPGIDIVLMDIMMPEMDGIEATQEIRKMNGFDKLPIIALTAKAMKGDREKCLEAGMSDYIAKPINMEQLLSLMRVWLYS